MQGRVVVVRQGASLMRKERRLLNRWRMVVGRPHPGKKVAFSKGRRAQVTLVPGVVRGEYAARDSKGHLI